MTSSRRLGLGLGALVASTALACASQGPAAAEEVPVGGAATFTVDGHGYGHGHGLSQYGALGAANQGVGWKQIIGFYYPGTDLGRARGPLKVLVTADTSKDVMVDARDGLRLHRLAGGKSYLLGKLRPRAGRWRIMPKGDKSVVSFRQSGRTGWTRWTAFAGSAEFTAGNKPLTLRLPGRGTASYRGALRSVGKDTVNVLPMDRYLQGVVPREVPAEWPADAVRAQSVAARSYAAYERAHATGHYDLCDTTSCQVYGGFDAEQAASNAAVRKTRGRIVQLPGRAGVHAVLVEQRRVELGRVAALPGRPAGPVRSVVRQPQRTLDHHRHQGPDREGLATGRHGDQPVLRPGRQRRLRRPGDVGDTDRQRRGR